ncbi:hypothetical protein ACEQUB_01009 [Ralstonia syzygii]
MLGHPTQVALDATTCAPGAAIRWQTMAMPARRSADTTTAGQPQDQHPFTRRPPPQQRNVSNGATGHQSHTPGPGNRLAMVFETRPPHQFQQSWRTCEHQRKQRGHRQHADRATGPKRQQTTPRCNSPKHCRHDRGAHKNPRRQAHPPVLLRKRKALHRKGCRRSGERRRGLRPLLTSHHGRRNTSVPLVPPKPKLFFTATSIFMSRAVLAQ